MVNSPYPVSGIALNTDGTTVVEGATATAYNVTKTEWLKASGKVTSNSIGEYVLDLANFPSDYEDADKVQIVVFTENRSLDFRHTLDTAVGSLDKGNTILHFSRANFGSCRVKTVNVSNTTGGGLRVDIFDRTNDDIIASFEVAGGETESTFFGEKGLLARGGFAVIYESETGGDPPELIASVVINDSI